MAARTSFLLLTIALSSPISAQNSTFPCGQPQSSPELAFSACCPSSSSTHHGTFQILDGQSFRYRCNAFVDLEGVQVAAGGPGPCAEACARSAACVSAAWDAGRAGPCYHYVATSRPGALRIEPVARDRADVASAVASARSAAEVSHRSQLSEAVASAVSSAESAAQLECKSRVPDTARACEGVKSAAETSCRLLVSFAASAAAAGAQSAAQTSCASHMDSAVSSAAVSAQEAAQTSCRSYASSAVAGAVASAESAAQTAHQSQVSSAVASAVTSASASASASCASKIQAWSTWAHYWSTQATSCRR